MRSKKSYAFTIGLVAIMLTLVMGFTFAPQVAADQCDQIYYSAEQLPVPLALSKETLSYTRKEVLLDTTMSPKTPTYYDRDACLPNGCAAVAGGIIVGYYDRLFENLIPNYVSYIKRGDMIIYKQVDSTSQSLMSDLFVRMDVNVGGAGATEEQFVNGLRAYVVDKGYNLTYKSYGKGSSIDYNAIANSLNSGKPVALLLTMSSIVTGLDIGDTSLTMTKNSYSAHHIVVANGIKRIRYYNGNNVIRTDTYLSVCTGLKEYTSGYIWLEDMTSVNNILGMEIT